jgi:hypothetical protein
MAETKIRDVRELIKAGTAPDLIDYITEDDAVEYAKKRTVVTVRGMEMRPVKDQDYWYWAGTYEIEGKIVLYDFPNGSRRDDLCEWLAVNTTTGPLKGFVFKNGAKAGKRPMIYLGYAE